MPDFSSSHIIGTSRAVREVRDLISQVAETDAPVMVFGESGTGKELVARSLHAESCRCRKAFVPVNMAALPATLVESTLFGHDRGAFTGATHTQPGLCEEASGGTLFLDEVSEMEYDAQSKLLRFLQDRSYRRVGSTRDRVSDTRIISATNRDSQKLVAEGVFREDLYYRLNVFPILVPSLRSRRDDVPLLVARFAADAGARYLKGPFHFTARALEALGNYDWPGNVRQLENLIHRVVILARQDLIDVQQLPPEILGDIKLPETLLPATPLVWESGELSRMEQLERAALLQSLVESGGNVRDAAESLGVALATAYRRIKRFGIPLNDMR